MKWEIQENEKGEKNLTLITNGNYHYIYSRTNPKAKAQRFFQSVFNGSGLYIIIGIGYFYHLLPFFKSKKVEHLIVVEPDDDLLELIKNEGYFIQMMADEKVNVIKGTGEVQKFIQDIKGDYSFLFYNRLNLLSYPPLERLLPDKYGYIRDKIKSALDELFRDALTIARFSKRWLLNFNDNLKGIIESYELSNLKEVYYGDCVVAAAGPNLDRAIKYLKKNKKGKYFIIAVDAAVRPLMLAGIIPNMIISIDPQPFIRLHFLDIEEDIKDIPAILNPMVHNDVFKLFTKRYLYPTRHPLLKIIESNGYLSTENFNFESVSALAIKTAYFLGFNELSLIGFDYAYSNYHSYANNSFFYKYILVNSGKLRPFFSIEMTYISKKLMGRNNKSNITSEDLNHYRVEMENLIKILKKEKMNFKLLRLFPSEIELKGTEIADAIPLLWNFLQIKRAKGIKIRLRLNILDNFNESIITSLAIYYRLIKGYDSKLAYKSAKTYHKIIFSLLKDKINQLHDKV